jgi:hypothetical protein
LVHALPTANSGLQEEHYDARNLFIELPDVHPFYMDRMVNFMYEATYSTSSPTSFPWIQDGCQLSPETFTAFGKTSPLDLEVRMCIHAADLRSTTLRDYALMSILALLEKGVSINDFAEAVQTAFVSHTGPPLLRELVAIYAAHMDEIWIRWSDVASYIKLMRIPDFSQQTHMAKHHCLRMVKAKGILPIPIISDNETTAAPLYLRKQPPPVPQAHQQLPSEFELCWSDGPLVH